tara:strand:+ start:600 stop:719 length:120 start_codon:yes stop_codon:yes gene_type:complete
LWEEEEEEKQREVWGESWFRDSPTHPKKALPEDLPSPHS